MKKPQREAPAEAEQVTRTQLETMTAQQIMAAADRGALDHLLGRNDK